MGKYFKHTQTAVNKEDSDTLQRDPAGGGGGGGGGGEGLFKADAVKEEDPERDRATQV